MGNKTSSSNKSPEPGEGLKEASGGGLIIDSSSDVLPALSPELLASLQTLGENSDFTLLPNSLHQIAEACSLRHDYQWAIQFLQLEKLYHQRLLSNLAALQENWEIQLQERKDSEDSFTDEPDTMSQKHLETLSHICRTHLRPSISEDPNQLNTMLKELQTQNETLHKANKPETSNLDEEKEQSLNSETFQEDEDGGEEETYEEGQEVEEEEEEEQHCEDTPEEEEVKVEWPSGVPQASDKDLAKLSHSEENSSPDGLVSILKRRRASLDGLPPPSTTDTKQNSKRKVRFSEPDDGIEQDEVGGDSCLVLLLLCLVTVVISVGGTALYCTLVDTYSNICTDFTHNVDFYVLNVRRFFEGLGRWMPLRT